MRSLSGVLQPSPQASKNQTKVGQLRSKQGDNEFYTFATLHFYAFAILVPQTSPQASKNQTKVGQLRRKQGDNDFYAFATLQLYAFAILVPQPISAGQQKLHLHMHDVVLAVGIEVHGRMLRQLGDL